MHFLTGGIGDARLPALLRQSYVRHRVGNKIGERHCWRRLPNRNTTIVNINMDPIIQRWIIVETKHQSFDRAIIFVVHKRTMVVFASITFLGYVLNTPNLRLRFRALRPHTGFIDLGIIVGERFRVMECISVGKLVQPTEITDPRTILPHALRVHFLRRVALVCHSLKAPPLSIALCSLRNQTERLVKLQRVSYLNAVATIIVMETTSVFACAARNLHRPTNGSNGQTSSNHRNEVGRKVPSDRKSTV